MLIMSLPLSQSLKHETRRHNVITTPHHVLIGCLHLMEAIPEARIRKGEFGQELRELRLGFWAENGGMGIEELGRTLGGWGRGLTNRLDFGFEGLDTWDSGRSERSSLEGL